MHDLHITLGSHLFPIELIQPEISAKAVFMCEAQDLATHFKYHKLKLHFFFTSMRRYAATLEKNWPVTYYALGKDDQTILKKSETVIFHQSSFFGCLTQHCKKHKIKSISLFYPEDRFFYRQIQDFSKTTNIKLMLLPSPLFINQPGDFVHYITKKKPFLKTYYEQQRRQHQILLNNDNTPVGGQWSFDDSNRKKIPKNTLIPASPPTFPSSNIHTQVNQLIESQFQQHPGSLDHQWYATTTAEARRHLQVFLQDRFAHFGDYQDALDLEHPFLFHSLLSPYINSGLLPAQEVIATALEFAKQNAIPLNCLEGFIRQILGWREFIFGIDQNFGAEQSEKNFFKHTRGLANSWYTATTGLEILDHCIQKSLDYGYNHHIERLMVTGNLMLLCEIKPIDAYTWFMELYIDSADWVMGPNVYGMSLFSDGGIFATKPYICGSNYILKQSHLKKGPWQDTMDGLYWRFIDKNLEFFKSQHRLSMMVRQLEKLEPTRKTRIFKAAEAFLEKNTTPS